MAEFDPTLANALAAWKVHATAEGADPGLAEQQVTVLVRYTGDRAALVAAGLEPGFESDGEVSGRIRLADVDALAAVPGVERITMEPRVRLLDGTVAEMRVPWRVPPTTPWPGRGANVIVAIIDTGIDIFHDSFRKADNSTRILEIWDQDLTAVGGANPPAGFQQIGKIYDGAAIKAALAGSPPFNTVDSNGHGTHVAGIAAGNGRQDDRCSFPGRYVGVAPEADLVIVRAISLPNNQSGAIRDAFNWCAQAGTRNVDAAHPVPRPVVINCSFGSDTGPHDGSGFLDGLVDQLLRPAGGPPPGLAVVVAAGNEGEGKTHENGIVAANGASTINFTMPAGSSVADILDIWYSGTATLSVTLTAPPNPAVPGPNTVGPIAPGTAGSPLPLGRMTIGITSSTGTFPASGNRKNIQISFNVPPNTSVRPGAWQLTLTETGGAAAIWEAWFATSHTDPYPTFDPSEGVPARRRTNTVDSPGMARNAITVANYTDDGTLAESSSRGPDPSPPGTPIGEVKPTLAAPGSSVAAPRSRNDPGKNSSCCDQLVIDKTGTSMASPHVAGLVALMLEKNRTLTFEQIRTTLQQSARTDGIPAAEVPPVYVDPSNTTGIRWNNLWGAGKANAAQALTAVPLLGGGGGGGGGPVIAVEEADWGYTPHTIFSRLADWQRRHGARPGLMLVAALVSEHVDEVLRLINHNPRVGAVWRRGGGPELVRLLLHGPAARQALLPAAVGGHAVAGLLDRLLPVLDRFGGPRLRGDIARFSGFAHAWPGADLDGLDAAALRLAASPGAPA